MAAPTFESRIDAAILAVKGRSLPATANLLSLAGIAWGVVAFAYGMFVPGPAHTWGAFLVALFFTIGVSQGGVVFAGIQQGTQARWGRPLKRIAESFVFFLPVLWCLLLLFVVAGGMRIYPWHPEVYSGHPVDLAPHSAAATASKELWLDPTFFLVRQLVGTGVLFGMSFLFVRNSLGPDLLMARQRLGSDTPRILGFLSYDAIIGGRTDVDDASERGLKANYTLVPFLGFAYAFVFSFLAFDLIMSLDPWWYSNMFGGWLFMSSILLGMCAIAVIGVASLDWLGLRSWVTTSQTHDLGKMMLAGTMFWGYTLFAQLLPIYYTDMPEETNFLMVRLMLPQWSWLAQVVAVLCFVAPFTILLSRGIKKMRWPFLGIAVVILTGQFLERSLLVMPAVHLGDTFPWLDFLVVNVGMIAGFVGLFVAVVGRVLASVPAIPVSDPLLRTHPWDVHVHSLSASHQHGH